MPRANLSAASVENICLYVSFPRSQLDRPTLTCVAFDRGKKRRNVMVFFLSKVESTTVHSIVTRAIYEAIVSNSKSCFAAQDTSQSIEIDAITGTVTGGINQYSNVTLDLGCLQNSVSQTDLQRDISKKINLAISQDSQAGQGLFLGISEASSRQILSTVDEISTSISMQDLQQCLAKQSSTQTTTVGEISGTVTGGINQKYSGSLVMKCIQESTNITSLTDKLTTELNSNIEQRSVAGLSTAGLAIVLGICLVCLLGSAAFAAFNY
jgi:hypothetical protein